MMMNRRQAIIGATAASIIRPKMSHADTLPMGVHFGGSTALINYGFSSPQNCSIGTLIYWFNANSFSNSGWSSIFEIGRATDNFAKVAISHFQDYVAGSWVADPDSTHYGFNGPVHNLPISNGQNHLMMIQWDSTVPYAKLRMDGGPVQTFDIGPSFDSVTLPFAGIPIVVGGWQNSQFPLAGSYVGDMFMLHAFIGMNVNISDNNLVDRYYASESNYAARIGWNGLGVLSGGVKPTISLAGPPLVFPLNLAAGNGSALSPDRGNTSGEFTVVGSPLTSSTSDPFEPGT